MFSGIVKEIGEVLSFENSRQQSVLKLKASLFEGSEIGASISVLGVCLTIVSMEKDVACFDLASETLRCTSLAGLKVGAKVNLEPALSLADKLDGHIVQGHVDAVAVLVSSEKQENTFKFSFTRPEEIADLIVPKGAIAIDGVSLTVGEVSNSEFSVYIVPHTFSNTTFSEYRCDGSEKVNLEADCVARYVKGILSNCHGRAECHNQ